MNISNSHTSGIFVSDVFGGLIGSFGGSVTILDSYSSGTFSISMYGGGPQLGFGIGGIIGSLWNGASLNISDSYASGTLNGQYYTGGIIGNATQNSSINMTNVSSDFEISSVNYVGGLIGAVNASTTITNSFANGNIVSGQRWVGGLIGLVGYDGLYYNLAPNNYKGNINISNSYTEGDVAGGAGNQYSLVGGFIGGIGDNNTTTISNSYSNTNVTSTYKLVGGFIGGVLARNSSVEISGCHATGNVINQNGADRTGGFIGGRTDNIYPDGSSMMRILNSYATGNVDGHFSVGGFIGDLSGNISDFIINSYATGNVDGEQEVGGFAGNIGYGTITNSRAIGDVYSSFNSGGFAGNIGFRATVTNSYAAGNLTGIFAGQSLGGGFVGLISGVVTNSYAIGSMTSLGPCIGDIS